ncbi:hypothetical protein FRC19_009754 [Serendipita sp. 401]|nr:hypothetical protein FRC19_009754 [Serendipita sp. 401]KAG8834384.1 hypothetical protein FRC18_002092 [Serendipita sp. 400]
MRMKYFSFKAAGTVQGVNFRRWAQKTAESRNITGWIRNHNAGHVEGEAFGDSQSMNDFKVLLKSGPRYAEVTEVTIDNEKEVATAEEIQWNMSRFEVKKDA